MVLGSRNIHYVVVKIIIVLLLSTTHLHGKDDSMGLGIGTRSCIHFLDETNEYHDDGTLKSVALFKRLEYLQWAYGFIYALNIRHYELDSKVQETLDQSLTIFVSHSL